jgi:glycosyltransferase-like protein LARGE
MHVDVTLVHMSRARVAAELLPINALRNTAVRLARTEFTLMLDVDMTPATESFACLRDPDGSFLSGLLPRDGDDVRIFTAPVFITDVHARAPPSKDALLNMLYHRAATAYCANSQKAAKIDRWYAAGAPYETRFATDYEPYGVCRRERHPEYDERFVGYGFNKVAWAWAAEAGGARLFVLSDSFVTHLNHVDNEWVSHIGVPQYLRTWRRYFAFVAEAVAIHGAPPAARYVPAYGPELRGT